MSLVNELIKDLIPEQENKTVAIYAGGFKPPTKGHFEVIKQALQEHPDVDEFLVYIGKKERDGITQPQSTLIWDIYKKYLPMKVKIIPLNIPPIKAVYNYAKDHPNTNILWVLGARQGNEDDFGDIASRTKSADKYDNLALAITTTKGGISGTAARNAANISIEKLIPFLPEDLSNEELAEVYNIMKNELSEGRKKKKDPKKGTGKKPKGSKRRLYTDEDPKDTIGIKFSTRQDIVDTLNKKSFKAKSHARQSQIINLIHQRVRAAYGRAKDPAVKKRLKTGLDYITKKKEASKKKTQRLKKLKEFYYIKNQEIPYSKNEVKFGFTTGKGINYITEFIRDDEVKNNWHFNFGIRNNKKIDYNSTTNKGEVFPVMETISDIIVEFLYNNTKVFNLIMKSSSSIDKEDNELYEDKSQRQRRLLFTRFIRKTPILSENKLSIDPQNALVWNVREKERQAVKENASYSNKINYPKLIKDFTKHMIKIGKNIQPLPRVIFKHNDSKNASDFFGRTAYYDPNNQTIVLYTEGRHPKDIVRSFAHEMVHHTQYLENRLGDVKTTNTNADDNLDRIEREAYLDGNMVFRNWTDSIDGDIVTSINEGKNKDPFGLNAFTYELAMLREDDKKYYIYLDMDGVVANFDKRFEDLSGMPPNEFVLKYGKNAFWDLIDEKHKVAFWRGIEIMPGAERLVNYVAQYPFEMLTAPSIKKQSIIGKGLWIKDKVGTLYSTKPKVTYRSAKQKHTVKPNLTKFDILIDDKSSTIDNWNNAGGTGIFYQNASQVINDLKKLGL